VRLLSVLGLVSLAAGGASANAQPGPFAGQGMWIWYVSESDGGNLSSIIADAHTYGVATLFIKSGDGTSTWPQFNAQLVSTLHAAGLHVCAWQYVYGDNPTAEAQVGAAAVSDGADCLAIDAEGEYEGKYASAQTYIQTLRGRVGANFPIALAGLPYIDDHPSFPYSVFLGPGGAQFDVPQMYWLDIGTSVDDVYAHTYEFNSLYGRPIAPLGQLDGSPSASDIMRFRQLAQAYGAPGLSWWDWQDVTATGWSAISQPLAPLTGLTPSSAVPTLATGATGDLVIWAQEHLYSAGQPIAIDGDFGPQTQAAVQAFQAAHGIATSAVIDAPTWQALLRYPPVAVTWTATGAVVGAPAPLAVEPPSVTVAAAADGSVALTAGPGGVAGVASWRALGGSSPSTLITVATASTQGAQTQITVGSEFAYFAVQALGSTGQLLASSQAVATPAHVAIYGRSVFVSPTGVGGLPAGCFTGSACHVTTTITAGKATIAATGREFLAAGGGVLHFALTAHGRALLARARERRLAVTATIRDRSGATAAVPVNLIPFAAGGPAPRRSIQDAPTLQVIGTSEFVFADHVGGILAGCFAAAPCAVHTTLSAGRSVIATAGPEVLGANELGYLIFRLTPNGHLLLARARGNRLAAKLTLTDGNATARASIALVGF
jgi:peptidoglycan hydrolase-like protein with peptidoglycan-binding domain